MHNKLILQQLWKFKIDWDELMPIDVSTHFQNWVESSKNLTNWKLPRGYFPQIAWKDLNNLELHGFCDASEKAYGAVVYIRTKVNNNYKVSFVMARGRVAPTKNISLPKLELLSALTLARLVQNVSDALQLESNRHLSTHYWCDSSVVIDWLKTDPYLLKTFVCALRVTYYLFRMT